jgi:hypothetical protein
VSFYYQVTEVNTKTLIYKHLILETAVSEVVILFRLFSFCFKYKNTDFDVFNIGIDATPKKKYKIYTLKPLK